MAHYWLTFFPENYYNESQGDDARLGSSFRCKPSQQYSWLSSRPCTEISITMAGPISALENLGTQTINCHATVTDIYNRSQRVENIQHRSNMNDGQTGWWFFSGLYWEPGYNWGPMDGYPQIMTFTINNTDITNYIYQQARQNTNYTFTLTTQFTSPKSDLQFMKCTEVYLYCNVPDYEKPNFPTVSQGATICKSDMDNLRAYLYYYQLYGGISAQYASEVTQGATINASDWTSYVTQHNSCSNTKGTPTRGALATADYYNSFNLG